jgi:hypothetical protein
MKTILILCSLTLVAGAALTWRAVRLPNLYGTFTETPAAEVADLIERPKDFVGRTVTVRGTVRQQCETMGCFFFFESGKRLLRVELAAIAMNAPKKRNGHPVRVEGQITPHGEGYQLYASAVEFQ